MRLSRRREARKIARMARVLVVLDDQARRARPAPRRTVTLSLR
jgi:hypothetical protein